MTIHKSPFIAAMESFKNVHSYESASKELPNYIEELFTLQKHDLTESASNEMHACYHLKDLRRISFTW